MASFSVYDGATWRTAQGIFVYDGSTWITGSSVHVYDGSTWRQVYTSDPCSGAPTLDSITCTYNSADVCGIGLRWDGTASITGTLGTTWEIEWQYADDSGATNWLTNSGTGTFTYQFQDGWGSDATGAKSHAYCTFRGRIIKVSDSTPCGSWVTSNTDDEFVKTCAA